jgi:arylsulfatase A-like enzyme
VGLVLDCLDRLDLTDRTVVVFTSDNGGVSSGDGFSTSNLPFRGGKGRQWEGGVREPFYVAWPGVTQGTTTQTPAIGMDFYPTFLEIAGLPLRPEQHLDGVSLVPVLKGASLPERPLFWHYPHYGNQGGEPSAMIREGNWKLIEYFEDGRHELYDLGRDGSEQHDLAAAEPARVSRLLAQLKAWQQQVGARFPTANPNYDPAAAERSAKKLREKGVPNREAQHARFLERDFTPQGGWWQDRARKRAAAR